MTFPSTDSPELQAFIMGFFLPFVSSCLGFAVFVVRKILSNVEDNI